MRANRPIVLGTKVYFNPRVTFTPRWPDFGSLSCKPQAAIRSCTCSATAGPKLYRGQSWYRYFDSSCSTTFLCGRETIETGIDGRDKQCSCREFPLTMPLKNSTYLLLSRHRPGHASLRRRKPTGRRLMQLSPDSI